MNKNIAYVSIFIGKHRESADKEFYENCRRNNITDNITREMHENYYYVL